MSEAILTRLPLSWAILEAILRSRRPSWSHLGPKRTLCHLGPPPVQTQGGGGGGNLPSRERQEDGKGNALDHLRPEGWWDFASRWHTLGLPLPRLDKVGLIDFKCIMFALLRASSSSVCARRVCRGWVKELSRLIERTSWGNNLVTEMPAINLPKDCITTLRSAYRGDDKMLLAANKFLCRRRGYNIADDFMFKEPPCFSRAWQLAP